MIPYSKRSREELEAMMNSDNISERQKFRIKAFLLKGHENPKKDPYEFSTGKWV